MTPELTVLAGQQTTREVSGGGSGYYREITISTAATLCAQLDFEASAAQAVAVARGEGGILMTRHDDHHFTIEITSEVPFGFTWERDRAL